MSRRLLPTLLLAAVLAGCGSSSAGSTTTAKSSRHRPGAATERPLAAAGTLAPLPEGRSGIAVAPYGSSVYVNGGLNTSTVSTDTIYKITPGQASGSAGTLPEAIHDAAAATIAGRLLVFGGGPSEGSTHILQVVPGPPHQVGSLPQALSDVSATGVGDTAYVVGGYNGSTAQGTIYAVKSDGSVSSAGSIPLGVRYPGAAALGGKIVIAGGETSAGLPTHHAWLFDPARGKTTPLPMLPAATDHAAAAVIGSTFYLLGGLHDGQFTDAIWAWSPGQTRWRSAGRLPAAVSDLGVAAFDGGILAIGGRGSAGQVPTVTLLRAR